MRRKILPFLAAAIPTTLWAQSTPTQTSTTTPPVRIAITPSGRTAPVPITTPPMPQDMALAAQRAGGSMLRAGLAAPPPDPTIPKLQGVSFFAVADPEPRNIKKHDLVTIIVSEESEFKSEGTTDLQRTADLDAKVDSFVRFSLANFALKTNTGGAAGGGTSPEIKTEGARDFKGQADVDRTDSLTARITAEVIDVKPNGTLVLQARQHIKTDEEEQTMIFSGICRVEDITADNTVLSSQIYDKDVSKTHRGAVRDTTKRGWASRLLDIVNPF